MNGEFECKYVGTGRSEGYVHRGKKNRINLEIDWI